MSMNVGNISAIPSTWTQLQEHGKSKTTWKTHALVVSGYLLIGIGIALVIASFYMSTIVHPLLALATPVAPFAAGTYLLNHAKDSSLVPSIFSGSPPPFKGIVNKGGNDCWINATMQLLLHIPAFAGRIKSASGGWRFFNHPLETFFSAFNGYQEGEAIDSQELRKELDRAGITSTSDTSQQDDPIRFLSHFMKNMGYQLPTLYEKEFDKVDGKIVRESENRTSSRNPVRFFDLAFYVDPKNPNLRNAMDRYFCDFETLPSGTERTRLRFMKRPPEEFGVSLPQAAEAGIAVKNPVDCPMNLEMPSRYLGEKASYACDGFFYHSGSGANSGHWMAVIKKEGKWWHASDSSVTEISEANALKKMRTASFIHYAKV